MVSIGDGCDQCIYLIFFIRSIFHLSYRSIWNKKYLGFREAKKSTANIIPSFKAFFDFEGLQSQKEETSMNFTETSEIAEKSEEGIQELAKEMFDSKKRKFLNLKEVKGKKENEGKLREEFEGFVKKVSRSVFMSGEGVYQEEEVSGLELGSLSLSEKEEEVDSGMNRFARAFS